MKILPKITILINVLSLFVLCQNQFYWKDAPVEGKKLYSIKFFNSNNGVAESQLEETLETIDNGKSWSITPITDKKKQPSNYLWSADIYCSVMRTTDGGITWVPYLKEPQEQFCAVYFKDKNTGWKVAEEFLNKVVNAIIKYSQHDDIESLVDQPNQCTEYYTSADSGWALGWCIRDFEK